LLRDSFCRGEAEVLRRTRFRGINLIDRRPTVTLLWHGESGDGSCGQDAMAIDFLGDRVQVHNC
jgi:hypothetical protein